MKKNFTLSFNFSLTLSHTLTLSLTLSLSPSLSHMHTHSLSHPEGLSLSLTHTYTPSLSVSPWNESSFFKLSRAPFDCVRLSRARLSVRKHGPVITLHKTVHYLSRNCFENVALISVLGEGTGEFEVVSGARCP